MGLGFFYSIGHRRREFWIQPFAKNPLSNDAPDAQSTTSALRMKPSPPTNSQVLATSDLCKNRARFGGFSAPEVQDRGRQTLFCCSAYRFQKPPGPRTARARATSRRGPGFQAPPSLIYVPFKISPAPLSPRLVRRGRPRHSRFALPGPCRV